jgi:hypothetical protein
MTKAAVSMAVLLAIAGAAAVRAEAPADPIGAVLVEYGLIHDALAADRVDGVVASATKIAELAKQAGDGNAGAETWNRLATAASAMSGSSLGELRGQLMELSKALAAAENASGSAATNLYYCPMVEAYWLQKKGDDAPRNPYYGKSMLNCGSKVDKVED